MKIIKKDISTPLTLNSSLFVRGDIITTDISFSDFENNKLYVNGNIVVSGAKPSKGGLSVREIYCTGTVNISAIAELKAYIIVADSIVVDKMATLAINRNIVEDAGQSLHLICNSVIVDGKEITKIAPVSITNEIVSIQIIYADGFLHIGKSVVPVNDGLNGLVEMFKNSSYSKECVPVTKHRYQDMIRIMRSVPNIGRVSNEINGFVLGDVVGSYFGYSLIAIGSVTVKEISVMNDIVAVNDIRVRRLAKFEQGIISCRDLISIEGKISISNTLIQDVSLIAASEIHLDSVYIKSSKKTPVFMANKIYLNGTLIKKYGFIVPASDGDVILVTEELVCIAFYTYTHDQFIKIGRADFNFKKDEFDRIVDILLSADKTGLLVEPLGMVF